MNEKHWKIRARRLSLLGFPDYKTYISSRLWRDTRSRYRRSDRPQDCILCGITEPIVLHHRTYERLGEERLDDLAPLCPRCHADVHAVEDRGDIDLADVESLKSAIRAEKYRPEREAAERRRLEGISKEEACRRRLKSIIGRLRHATSASIRQGTPIDRELAEIEAAIIQIEKRPHEAAVSR